MQSIDTSDISRWFTKNSTYQFLHRINPSTFNVSTKHGFNFSVHKIVPCNVIEKRIRSMRWLFLDLVIIT